MMRYLSVILLAGSLLMFTGCSDYIDGYEYAPRPALAEIPPTPPDQGSPMAALTSIIGIRTGDVRKGIPESVEVRVRVDNNGSHRITLDPATLVLTDGSLVTFPPPVLQPPNLVDLAPAQSAMLTAFFPFPNGKSYDDMDMQSLQLRWFLKIDSSKVGQVVYFHRVWYSNPTPPPPVVFGGGVLFIRR